MLRQEMMRKKQSVRKGSKKSFLREEKDSPKSSASNVKQSRATFILDEDVLNQLRAMAYWERKQIKTVLHEALRAHFELKGEDYVKDALEHYRSKDHEC